MSDDDAGGFDTPEFHDWLRCYHVSTEIIAGAFEECGQSKEEAMHNAAAVLARLAHHDPPISVDWLKEST